MNVLTSILCWCVCLVGIGLMANAASAEVASQGIDLTPAERAYLADHNTLTIGFSKDFEPYLIDGPQGNHAGVYPELYSLIAEKLGIHLAYSLMEWNSVLDALENGRVDVIPKVNRQTAVQRGFRTIEPLTVGAFRVFVSENNLTVADSLADLSGKRVAYHDKVLDLGRFLSGYRDTMQLIPVAHPLDGFSLLDNGKADAYIDMKAAEYLLKKYEGRSIYPLYTLTELRDESVTAVKPQAPAELLTILSKAVSSISADEKEAILRKWFGGDVSEQNRELNLTDQEKQWLQENRKFTVCNQYDLYPHSGYQNGRITGLSGDILKEVSKTLGITFSGLDVSSPQDLDDKVANGQCDMVAVVAAGQKRFPSIKSTMTVGSDPLASAGNLNSFFLDARQSTEGHTFYVRYHALRSMLMRNYPSLNVVIEHNLDTIMDKVFRDKNCHYVDVHLSLEYIIQHYGIDKFKLNGIFNRTVVEGALGVHEKHPVLLTVLNKALADMGKQKFRQIGAKYSIREFIIKPDYSYLWYALGFIVLLSAGLIILAHYARKIRISRKNLATIVRDAANAIFILDMQGNLVRVSLEAAKLFGFSVEEMEGKNITDIDPDSTPEDIEKAVQRAENGMYSTERMSRVKDGSLVPVSIVVKKIFLSGKPHLFCSVHNITELKMKEQALQKSQERLQLAMEGGNVGVWDWDLTTGELEFSANLSKMLGYSADETEITSANWKQFVYPEDLAAIEEAAAGILSGDTDRIDYVYRMVGKDGKICWVMDRGVVSAWDENGDPLQMKGTFSDISFVKELQRQQESLELQLQQAQKLEAIGTLAGGIAHDFNNILSVIMGYTEIALSEIPDNLLAHKDLQEVLAAGNRAKDMVSQILAFSRHDKSGQKIIWPKSVVDDAVKLLRRSLPSTIFIRENIDENCQKIRANATQLQQIIMNLCTNAYHAMEEQGGVLSIGLETVELNQADLEGSPQQSPGAYIRLTIEDTGEGIEPEVLKHIFEPFFTTKSVEKGTGMGLAVVHGIVENHGGFVQVQSSPGKGASFKIFFPEFQGEEEVEEPFQDRPLQTGNERILFVDDEPQLVSMAKQQLEQLGYIVTAVTSSMEAFGLIQSSPEAIDLVITDQTMPEMTGGELARKILELIPEMPIILCTGYSSTITKDQALSMGIRKFLSKPVLVKELSTMIRDIFDIEHEGTR